MRIAASGAFHGPVSTAARQGARYIFSLSLANGTE